MSKIKTREKGKDIKVLDKSAVVGQCMKNAFIRSKRNAAALMDDRQTTPSEYAGDQVEFAADDLAHDAAMVTITSTAAAVRQGRNLFRHQQKKRIAEKQQESTSPTEQPLALGPSQSTAPEGPLPQRRSGTVPEGRLPCRRTDTSLDRLRPANTTTSAIMERRQTSAKGRALQKRQVKNSALQPIRPPQRRLLDADEVSWSIGMVSNPVEIPVKTAKRPAKAMERAIKTTNRGDAIKGVQQRIKTVQHTSKPAIKATGYTARAAQKTAQITHTTGKAAASTVKVTRKGASVSLKAIAASAKALVTTILAGGWVAILAIVIICLIGLVASSCFGIFFSGEDSGTGQTMPAVVREINQEYEGKLDEIKNNIDYNTLEMSGTRALWPEVLAIYAVKTTTDPDNPLEVATMDSRKKELLKEIFWAMNEISSRTETTAATQIVETDDGLGNIIEEEVEVTTTTLYITVTHKTTDEMVDIYNFTADQRAQLAELLTEENRSMWSGVLYGIGAGDGAIVTVALSQLGNMGGQPYWSWYGFSSRVEWCACFVSWCANECGYLDAGIIPKFAGPEIAVQWFKERGLWQDANYEPRPGDIIFFDWDNRGSSGPQNGFPNHVGIVEKVEDGLVCTVEGNTGDSCKQRRYTAGHYEILGYGTPIYGS